MEVKYTPRKERGTRSERILNLPLQDIGIVIVNAHSGAFQQRLQNE